MRAFSQINGQAIDILTPLHAASGVGIGLLRVPWWAAFAAATLWEVSEYYITKAYPDLLFGGPDIAINSVIDIAALMSGWGAVEMGRRIRWRRRIGSRRVRR